jgi:hypothetical protein
MQTQNRFVLFIVSLSVACAAHATGFNKLDKAVPFIALAAFAVTVGLFRDAERCLMSRFAAFKACALLALALGAGSAYAHGFGGIEELLKYFFLAIVLVIVLIVLAGLGLKRLQKSKPGSAIVSKVLLVLALVLGGAVLAGMLFAFIPWR